MSYVPKGQVNICICILLNNFNTEIFPYFVFFLPLLAV